MLVDRVGSRIVLLVGIVCVAAAMIPMTLVTSLWQVYVFYGLFAAFGFAATSPVNTTALVNGWFEKRRGLALSLATSGAAYGQLLIVPVVTAIMIWASWRTAYIAIAATLMLVILPIAFFAVRDAPNRAELAARRRASNEPKVTIGQAVRTAAYWQLSFGMFVCGFTMGFTQVHMIPYLTDMPEHSHSTMQTTASLALSIVGLCSIVGAIVLGAMSDRYGHRQMLTLTYFLRGLAFLILLAVGSYIPGIFIAAIVLGISWTSTTPLGSAITADIFGRASLATIFGFIFTAMNVGSGVGALVAGIDRDMFGNYHAALIANVAAGFLAAAATWTIRTNPVRNAPLEGAPLPDGLSLGLPSRSGVGD
jgi:MFS family permease